MINSLAGWVEPKIDGRTGVARRETSVPRLEEREQPDEDWDRVRELPAS